MYESIERGLKDGSSEGLSLVKISENAAPTARAKARRVISWRGRRAKKFYMLLNFEFRRSTASRFLLRCVE